MTWAEAHSRNFKVQYNRLLRKGIGRTKKTKSNKKIQELANFLNDVFYPEDNDSDNKKFIDGLMKAIAEDFDPKSIKLIENFDLGTINIAKSETLSEETIINALNNVYKSERERHTIYYSTLQKELNTLSNYLANLSEESLFQITGSRFVLTQKGHLAGLYHRLSTYVKENEGENTSKYLSKINLSNEKLYGYAELKKDMQALKEILEILKSVSIPNKFYGDIFEWSIAAISGKTKEDIIKEVAKGAFEDILKKAKGETSGAEKTKRKELSIKKNISKLTDLYEKSGSNLKKQKNTTFEVGEFKFNLDIDIDPYQNRQGKMDVNFQLKLDDNTTPTPFRISAKSWTDFGSDFGETSVGAALMRTSGFDWTQAYTLGLTMGNYLTYNSGSLYDYDIFSANLLQPYYNQIHNFAKVSLLLDILMGYSQINLYADTIVINQRSQKKVYVASIAQILNEIKTQINSDKGWNINDYKQNDLLNKLQNLYNAILNRDGKLDEDTFFAYGYRYLLQQKVALRFSDLNARKLFKTKGGATAEDKS